MKIAKRMRDAQEKIENKLYSLEEGLKLLKSLPTCKFDETLDMAVCLNIDVKGAQPLRGVVDLPEGTGKTVRVAVFARGPKAEEAKKAGADIVGAEDLMETIQKGELNFDRCIATPDMMGIVGRIGRFLGPKGLMPNPKLGTVTMDVAAAIKAAKGGQIEYRMDKAGVVHAGLGKMSFEGAALEKNVKTFIEVLQKAKPQGSKGVYMKKAYLSSTMGPSIGLSLSELGA